jgi:hypothetical protein
MNTKLTLTMEQTVIEKARKYASDTERSLSDLVENYFKALTRESAPAEIEITPLVRSLQGAFHAPEDMDYQKELADRLTNKYR